MSLRWPQPLFAVPSRLCRRHCYWNFVEGPVCWCPERFLSFPHSSCYWEYQRQAIIKQVSPVQEICGGEMRGQATSVIFLWSSVKRDSSDGHISRLSASFKTNSYLIPSIHSPPHRSPPPTFSRYAQSKQSAELNGRETEEVQCLTMFPFCPLHNLSPHPPHPFLPSVTRMKGLQSLVWFLLEPMPHWILPGDLGDLELCGLNQ